MKNLQEFINQNRKRWERLGGLIRKKRRTFNEIKEMGTLYQQTEEDLSFSQTYFPASDVKSFLNSLIRRCQMVFYKPEKGRLRSFFRFFTQTLPRTFAEIRWEIVLSTSIFLFFSFLSFFMVLKNVEMAEIFLDDATYSMVLDDLESREQFGNFNNIPPKTRVPLSFFIWANNSLVSLYCFVLGATLGIGTVYILISNGFMLGALSAVYYLNGHFLDFFSLIMIHGSLELPAIMIAGGAGLHIGSAILWPRRFSRSYRLKTNTARAFVAFIGVVMILLISGLIEGLITPSKPSLPMRFTLMIINSAVLVLYFSRGYLLSVRDRKRLLSD